MNRYPFRDRINPSKLVEKIDKRDNTTRTLSCLGVIIGVVCWLWFIDVKRNEDKMNARGRQITAARRGVDTIKEANQMGMTVAEYLELIE